MPPAASQFPTFDEWKTMSEREQDALLDRLESEKRRGTMATRLLIGLACAAVPVAVWLALRGLG
jgi:orotate phosphoribosyltransferase